MQAQGSSLVSSRAVFDPALEHLRASLQELDASSLVSITEQFWSLANLDALTGLPNRMSFTEKLANAIKAAKPEPFALVILDVDNFKSINDSLGHAMGDELLRLVAQRLQATVMPADVVGRLGGDEFAIILRGVKSLQDVHRPLQDLILCIEAPIDILGKNNCTISMGAAHFPSNALDVEDLVRCADIALNSSKSKGLSHYTLFRPEHKLQVERKAGFLRDIEEALNAQSLLLHYQPIVDPRTSTVVALEALLRWNHPRHGFMTAGGFQVVFENMAVAARIGKLVTEMAVRQAAQWKRENVAFGKIGINVTAADFVLGDFPDLLASRLEHYGVAPHYICVEVTEGMFLGQSAERVLKGLNVLHEMGVEIAFDDFGTGYASLTHLKMPIDRLKIDKSFVSNIETDQHNCAIIQAVVALGRGLCKEITVEGVETEEQARILLELGCSQHQGYLYSKPLPAPAVAGFVEAFSRFSL